MPKLKNSNETFWVIFQTFPKHAKMMRHFWWFSTIVYLTLQLLFLWYTAVVSKAKSQRLFFMAKITKSCSCSREPNSKSFLDTSSYRAQADDPSKVCLTLTASIVWNKSKNVELFSAKNWIPCPKRNFEFSRQIIVNQVRWASLGILNIIWVS